MFVKFSIAHCTLVAVKKPACDGVVCGAIAAIAEVNNEKFNFEVAR